MTLEEVKQIEEDIKLLKRKTRDIQSKRDRLEGERQHLQAAKAEICKRAQTEFDLTPLELEEMLPQWVADLSREVEEVKKMIGEVA